jgi:hypothetical protein
MLETIQAPKVNASNQTQAGSERAVAGAAHAADPFSRADFSQRTADTAPQPMMAAQHNETASAQGTSLTGAQKVGRVVDGILGKVGGCAAIAGLCGTLGSFAHAVLASDTAATASQTLGAKAFPLAAGILVAGFVSSFMHGIQRMGEAEKNYLPFDRTVGSAVRFLSGVGGAALFAGSAATVLAGWFMGYAGFEAKAILGSTIGTIVAGVSLLASVGPRGVVELGRRLVSPSS